MITVKIYLVDGGYDEWKQPLNILATYDRLVHEGYSGKQLIHRLLTDDWGPPPVRVVLTGLGSDGKPIEIVILIGRPRRTHRWTRSTQLQCAAMFRALAETKSANRPPDCGAG